MPEDIPFRYLMTGLTGSIGFAVARTLVAFAPMLKHLPLVSLDLRLL